MKTKLFLIALFFTSIHAVCAQTPIIVDFRKILNDGPSQFNNIQKDFLQEDSVSGHKFYSSQIADLPISQSYIKRKENEIPQYVMDFDIENMDTMMLGLFTNISSQYMAELNDMVKSGQYKGEDYNADDGRSVTEITNLKNELVFQYVSDSKYHTLFFYGISK